MQSFLLRCWLLFWRFVKMLHVHVQRSPLQLAGLQFSGSMAWPSAQVRQLEASPSKGAALDPWRATLHQCSSVQTCLSTLASFCHLVAVKWAVKTQRGTVHRAQARWSVGSDGLAVGWAASSESWIKSGGGLWVDVSPLFYKDDLQVDTFDWSWRFFCGIFWWSKEGEGREGKWFLITGAQQGSVCSEYPAWRQQEILV